MWPVIDNPILTGVSRYEAVLGEEKLGRVCLGANRSKVYDLRLATTLSSVTPEDPFDQPIQIPVTDVFDLHSVAPRDVKEVVEEYVAEAHRLGFKNLRIIHGRGIGFQREIVRTVLASLPYVTYYGDAPAEAGGWGATIVTLL
jgi:dsDNA-specific endonuclease/ATPase MutS2